MASYKLLSYSVNQLDPETYITEIEYTFDNGQKVVVDVSHFRPQSLQQVVDGVVSRGKSVWTKLKAISDAEATASVLQPYVGQSFNFSQT